MQFTVHKKVVSNWVARETVKTFDSSQCNDCYDYSNKPIKSSQEDLCFWLLSASCCPFYVTPTHWTAPVIFPSRQTVTSDASIFLHKGSVPHCRWHLDKFIHD